MCVQMGKVVKRLSVQQDNELGLMLDIGRKYFSAADLFELIDKMHQLGYNLLHLHFSENEGFGLECALLKQPCLNGILTKMQLTEVVDYARKHNIAVMGELGMPGHMGAILKQWLC
jgi:hexosaminidase